MNNEQPKYQGSCYCGAVKVTVVGPSVAAGYCHCHSCRKWHSAPINAWSGWSKDDVEITGKTTTSEQSSQSKRISCAGCGGGVANELPQLGMIVVYPMTLAGSDFKFEPEMHLFYAERVVDFNDGLPKFVDMPEAHGGSGKMISEDGRTGWRAV